MKHRITALALVAALPIAHAQQAGPDLNATQSHGRQVFAQSCGVCHLPASLGAKTYGPLLNRATAAGNDEAIKIIIANGSERMPAFKYYLKPAEIDAIVAYVKSVPAPAVGATAQSKGESR
jgi:mono/diheme cytochrome c family protein